MIRSHQSTNEQRVRVTRGRNQSTIVRARRSNDKPVRLGIALDATNQLDALLSTMIPAMEMDQGTFDLVLRGLMPRLSELTSVVLSVLGGDDGRETEEMRQVIWGRQS